MTTLYDGGARVTSLLLRAARGALEYNPPHKSQAPFRQI